MAHTIGHESVEKTVRVPAGTESIYGTLTIPKDATAAIIFAHGSGSSRHSPRNIFVAKALQKAGLATLLVDLLTEDEERVDSATAQHRFDIELLTDRITAANNWLARNYSHPSFRIGFFGANTGAAAALMASANRFDIPAIVSRGGRPDLAGRALHHVRAPTLLIVGGLDLPVVELNRAALAQLDQVAAKELVIVPGATYLFEEPGALAEVARLTTDWFARYLGAHLGRHSESEAGVHGTPPKRPIH